jgi:hypothetical protein
LSSTALIVGLTWLAAGGIYLVTRGAAFERESAATPFSTH